MAKGLGKGLGKGFGSLLPTDFDESMLLDKKDRVQKVLITDITPDPNQPRRTFSEAELDELRQSIERHGVLQPIVLTPYEDSYIIVAGERRYRAAKKAGLTHLPALVRTIEELERLEIGLIENMQRVDLSPLEQAVSIARLNEQFNIDQKEIAKRLGKAHTTVVNIVRLLQLPEHARLALEQGKITEGHARAVLALKEMPEKQKELVDFIIKNKWSVRQAEQFVVATKIRNEQKSEKPDTGSTKKHGQLAGALGKKLGAKVKITNTKKGAKLQIDFKSESELEELIERLI